MTWGNQPLESATPVASDVSYLLEPYHWWQWVNLVTWWYPLNGFFFNITLPRGGAFGAGLVSKRKRWGFYCIFTFASCLLVMLCFYRFLTVFVTALSHHIITLWLRSQLLNQLFVRKVSGMNQECMYMNFCGYFE